MPYNIYQGPGWAEAFIAARNARQRDDANRQDLEIQKMKAEQFREQQRMAELLPEARQYASQGRPEMLRMLAPGELLRMEQADVASGKLDLERKKLQKQRGLESSKMLLGSLVAAQRDPSRWGEAVGLMRKSGMIIPQGTEQTAPQPEQIQQLIEDQKMKVSLLGNPKTSKIMDEVLPLHGYTSETAAVALQDPAVLKDLRTAYKLSHTKEERKDLAAPLRKEFQGLQTIKEAYLAELMAKKVESTTANAAGDMSLVFAYMKILDPSSSVRESEQAQAAEAGSVPQRVLAIYNRTVDGERLHPVMREQFKREARVLLNVHRERFAHIASQYRDLAKRQGIDPQDVVLNPGWSVEKLMADLAKPSSKQASAKTKAITDGKIVRFIGASDAMPAGWRSAD